MKHILDVNMLIAAIWEGHQFHSKADAWVKGKKIATCPITELGFLRITTNPRTMGFAMDDARTMLRQFSAAHNAEFVPDDLPALSAAAERSNQVTDLYLAELASRHGMKLATFDGGIRHPAVEGI